MVHPRQRCWVPIQLCQRRFKLNFFNLAVFLIPTNQLLSNWMVFTCAYLIFSRNSWNLKWIEMISPRCVQRRQEEPFSTAIPRGQCSQWPKCTAHAVRPRIGNPSLARYEGVSCVAFPTPGEFVDATSCAPQWFSRFWSPNASTIIVTTVSFTIALPCFTFITHYLHYIYPIRKDSIVNNHWTKLCAWIIDLEAVGLDYLQT